MARQQNSQRDAAAWRSPKATDASREKDVIALFDKADAKSDLRLVVHNVGGNALIPLLQTEASVFAAM